MDSFNINISPETQEIVITQGEPINISINEDVIQINQTKENYNLNFEGEVVKIDANYPQALEAARIATEKAEEATQIVEGFDEHVSDKIAEYDSNASDKIAEYNQNATEKTNEFDLNAQDKTGDFNDNAVDKTNDFNDNASDKTSLFNDNYTDKLNDFNSNATDKTTDFNDNYIAKKEIIDEKAEEASGYADTAKQYAIGDPTEPTGNSAKYWAEQSAAELSGLTSRVSTIEGKIPSAASSSNQLADKDWVENKGYITGITSGDVTTALGYTPYNSSNPNGYTSNVGTVTSVNNTSPDGNGNVTITIPDPLPSQTGQSGKFLTTNGTDASWADVDALPSQTGQSGKFLTTNGNSASWETVSVTGDNKSITKNSSQELQTVGVINSRDSSTAVKTWTGTKAQYNAIASKDPNTLYNITDDTDVSLTILEALYPVGSVYITTANTCPLSTLISGSTWELVSSGRVLQGADSNHAAGTTIEAGLPNITGSIGGGYNYVFSNGTGAFISRGFGNTNNVNINGSSNVNNGMDFDASQSNSIYGNSTTVQSPAYVVNIYRRVS